MSILKLSDIFKNQLDKSSRFDAEFFSKEFLSINSIIQSKANDTLLNLSNKIDVGFVGSMVNEYTDKGIILLQTKNIDEFNVKFTDLIYINKKFHSKLTKSQINFGDILIARSGSFGKASIYQNNETINSSDIIIVQANEKRVNKFYLTAFLNSNLGKKQLFRFASGGLQGHVNLTILENLIVSLPNFDFQNKIETTITQAHSKREKSKIMYSTAESLLLEIIGLQGITPNEDAVNIKSFKESFLATGRLDAEYYQKKYESIEKVVSQYKGGYKKLGDCIKEINTGEFANNYSKKDISLKFYIRNTNIKNGQIVEDENYFVDTNGLTKFTKEGDILTARVGAIGNFGTINKDYEGCVYSDNVLCIKMKEIFLPDVYCCYFSSKPINLLLEKISGGSVQPLITQTSIRDLVVPIIDIKSQQKISKLIQESFALKKESEYLLEKAKRAVEIAIEKNEKEAIRFIESE